MPPTRDVPAPASAPVMGDAPGPDDAQGGARARHRHGRDAPAHPVGTVDVDVAFYHRSRLARQAALKAALQDDTAAGDQPERCKGLEHCKHTSPGVPGGRVSTRVDLKPAPKP